MREIPRPIRSLLESVGEEYARLWIRVRFVFYDQGQRPFCNAANYMIFA